MKPEVFVGDDVGSDHYPLHCTLTFGSHYPENPIYFRKVSQLNETRFKELIDIGISSIPEAFETARELDRVAEKLPQIVTNAFEGACPLTKVTHKRRPVTPFIMELIRSKRKLRRKKGKAFTNGNPQEVQSIQRQMN